MNPLISIVIANYNYGHFLEDAIRSVLSQRMGDKVELIVCDAASTDNSVEIIKKHAEHLAWWCSEKDGGQSAAFNKGFSHAKGRFLTWLNADDVMMQGSLARVIAAIEANPKCEWFAPSSVWCDAELKIENCFCSHRFSYLRANFGFMAVGAPSSFFTKRLLDSVGGIDESLHFVMDTDLWLKFYKKANVKYKRIPYPVFAFRIHEESKMSGGDVVMSERAKRNRERAHLETKLLGERYSLPQSRIVYRLANLLSFSFVDKVRSKVWTYKRRGTYAPNW